MTNKTKIYFASDFHLGAPDYNSSLVREKKIVRWLDEIKADAKELYLIGDLFDFWFEYKYTVPKGFTRLLGKLAELSDNGTQISIFTGNHDLWMKDYLVKELNAKIYRDIEIREIDGKIFYIAHGDGLGPGDMGFKMMKKVFTSPLSKWLYSRVHPNAGISIANYFSRKSRAHTGKNDAKFLGEEKEWLIIHSKEILKKQKVDYFIYGHRHYPLSLPINGATYINLGDWINYFTYAVWDGEKLELKEYKG